MIEQKQSAGHAPASETPKGNDHDSNTWLDVVRCALCDQWILDRGDMACIDCVKLSQVLPPASKTGQASAWQMISSAPKDGSTFIGGHSRGGRHITTWNDRFKTWDIACLNGDSWNPSHWMPLPLAPSEDETTTKI